MTSKAAAEKPAATRTAASAAKPAAKPVPAARKPAAASEPGGTARRTTAKPAQDYAPAARARSVAASTSKPVSAARVTVPVSAGPGSIELQDVLVAMPGRIVVVAGELPWALDVANWLCRRMRIAPNRTLIAGPVEVGGDHQRICGPEHAAVMASSLRGGDAPVIVAVDAPVSEPDGGRWAGAVAEALGADAVVAVLDATRRTADLRRHLTDLGKAHAIAVYAASASDEPTAVLDLGLPLLMVDGRPVGEGGPEQALRTAR